MSSRVRQSHKTSGLWPEQLKPVLPLLLHQKNILVVFFLNKKGQEKDKTRLPQKSKNCKATNNPKLKHQQYVQLHVQPEKMESIKWPFPWSYEEWVFHWEQFATKWFLRNLREAFW